MFEVTSYEGTTFGSYVLGLAFAFGWTPCIGPQLGAILSLAASNGSVLKGTVLLSFYAIGLGYRVKKIEDKTQKNPKP